MNDLLMLAALLEGPKHGYALKKQAGLISGQSDLHNNLVYPLLRRFVSKGWVTHKKAAGQRGQTRQVYVLTPTGRKAIVDRICDFDQKAAASDEEFRIRVGLFPILTSPQRQSILDARQAHLLRRLQRFAPLKKEMDLGEYGGKVVEFIEQQMQGELAWIEKLRRYDQRSSKSSTLTRGGKSR